jgi:hypothetical protein
MTRRAEATPRSAKRSLRDRTLAHYPPPRTRMTCLGIVVLAPPGQFRPLIFTQLGPVTAAAPVRVHPVPQGPLVDPRSLATCAIGFPVSRTSRTAPSLKS